MLYTSVSKRITLNASVANNSRQMVGLQRAEGKQGYGNLAPRNIPQATYDAGLNAMHL